MSLCYTNLICQFEKISTECAINAFTSNRTKYDHVNRRQLINHKWCRQQLNSDKVIAEISTQDKRKCIYQLQKRSYTNSNHRVAMVSDKISIVPALITTDVGIATVNNYQSYRWYLEIYYKWHIALILREKNHNKIKQNLF